MSWHTAIVETLLRGSDRQLYHTNRHFQHSLDTLVSMLPAMVDGLARAAESDELRDRQLHKLQQTSRNVMFVPDYLIDAGLPDVVKRLRPLLVDKHCNCNDPNFTDSVKPVEAWWRCLTCKGLVWMGNGAEPQGEISWSNG